ncbi:MAG: hypothetical protein CMJ78_01120 [Planctomycetaceae bacterium]|nr:hypothetical protein [Planctomycetaceae bacterium]
MLVKKIKDSIYKLDLNDESLVTIDESGKSIAYFATEANIAIDRKVIEELKKTSKILGKRDIRICLHNSRDSSLHSMINLIYKKEKHVPHKHIEKSECYHMIEGQMKITTFDEKGKIVDVCILDRNDTFVFRIGKDTFHTTIPETELVIFHETRPGPFPPNGDSVYIN